MFANGLYAAFIKHIEISRAKGVKPFDRRQAFRKLATLPTKGAARMPLTRVRIGNQWDAANRAMREFESHALRHLIFNFRLPIADLEQHEVRYNRGAQGSQSRCANDVGEIMGADIHPGEPDQNRN